MFLPSGDQMPPSASVEMLVIFLGSPLTAPPAESKLTDHICELPSRLLVKMNCLPSGDQRPRSSPAGSEVNCRLSPPAKGTSHKWGVFLLSFRLTSTAENKTHLPSGEITGLLMRFSSMMSSKVNGRFD